MTKIVTLSVTQGLKPPLKGNYVSLWEAFKNFFIPESEKTIEIIEEKYRIDWNNEAERHQFTTLDLWHNQIIDISCLIHLPQLTKLSLNVNKISNIIPLAKLMQLTELDLSNNLISDIIPLSKLKKLTILDLTSNQITHIPEALLMLNLEITLKARTNNEEDYGKIFLGGNSLQEPPLEIVTKGNEAMQGYFFDKSNPLKFRLEYKFILPNELIPCLISELTPHSTKKFMVEQDIFIQNEYCTVKIIHDESQGWCKTIDIHVNGEEQQRTYFLHIIRKKIHEIHQKKFKDSVFSEMLPCSCRECITKNDPHFFLFSTLVQNYQNDHRDTIKCVKSNESIAVHDLVKEVLIRDEIEIAQQKERQMGDTITIKGNVTGSVVGRGSNYSTITTTNNDLKTLLEAFQKEASKIADQLPKDQHESFTEDAQTFITKVQENKKDKYFTLSKEGLIEAAQAVGEVGATFMELIPQIMKFLG